MIYNRIKSKNEIWIDIEIRSKFRIQNKIEIWIATVKHVDRNFDKN